MTTAKPTITCPFILPVILGDREFEIYLGHEDVHFVIGKKLEIRKGFGGANYYAYVAGLPLHRLIVDAPARFQVHHVSMNTLDNRRCNLRIVTAFEHAQYHKDIT